jgi:uncharacterized protein (TIGR04255 family)
MSSRAWVEGGSLQVRFRFGRLAIFPIPEQEPFQLDKPSHEVYPSAPLRFVAFEARFSPVPSFATQDGRMAIYDSLRELFPILQAEPGPAAPAVGFVIEPAQQMRLVDRGRTIAATISPTVFSIETSDYQHFDWFLDLIHRAFAELMTVAVVPTLSRVGLRYTDEIRVPGVNSPEDWKDFVDPSLLGPLGLVDGLVSENYQGHVSFRVHDHHLIHFRYGATEGWSVDPGGPLRVENLGSGPYFLIDLDSFWTAPDTEFPEFSVDTTVSLVKDLHHPLRCLFEASITERLRDSVFRKEAMSDRSGEEESDGY